MEFTLDLTINTNAAEFEQWLRQYTPDSIPLYINDGYVLENKEERKYLKIPGSPFLVDDTGGTRTYAIEAITGSMDASQEDMGSKISIPILKLSELARDRIVVKIIRSMDYSSYNIGLFYDDLHQKITQLWPETKRTIVYSQISDSMDLNTTLFEFIIEAEPNNFLDWCHTTFHDLHPGWFTRKIGDTEYITQSSAEILPPDNDNPTWQYLIFAHDIVYAEGETTDEIGVSRGFSGVIAEIEVRQIRKDLFKVKLSCGTDYPQILVWLIAFERRLLSVYQPVKTLSSTGSGIIARGEFGSRDLSELISTIGQFADGASWRFEKIFEGYGLTLFSLENNVMIPLSVGQIRMWEAPENKTEWEIYCEHSEYRDDLDRLSGEMRLVVPKGSQKAPIYTYADKPWERIEEGIVYQDVVKLWWDGLTYGAIAARLNYEHDTVRNYISDLRKEYGEAVVPYKKNLKRNRR